MGGEGEYDQFTLVGSLWPGSREREATTLVPGGLGVVWASSLSPRQHISGETTALSQPPSLSHARAGYTHVHTEDAAKP